MNELINNQNNNLIDIQSQIERLHLIFNLHEVPSQDLLDVTDVNWNVTHLVHTLPVHLGDLGEVVLDLLLQTGDQQLDGTADQTIHKQTIT